MESDPRIERLIDIHVKKWRIALEKRGAKVTQRGIDSQREIQRVMIDIALSGKSEEEKEAWLNSKLST